MDILPRVIFPLGTKPVVAGQAPGLDPAARADIFCRTFQDFGCVKRPSKTTEDDVIADRDFLDVEIEEVPLDDVVLAECRTDGVLLFDMNNIESGCRGTAYKKARQHKPRGEGGQVSGIGVPGFSGRRPRAARRYFAPLRTSYRTVSTV